MFVVAQGPISPLSPEPAHEEETGGVEFSMADMQAEARRGLQRDPSSWGCVIWAVVGPLQRP